jgi:hypothetical protein
MEMKKYFFLAFFITLIAGCTSNILPSEYTINDTILLGNSLEVNILSLNITEYAEKSYLYSLDTYWDKAEENKIYYILTADFKNNGSETITFVGKEFYLMDQEGYLYNNENDEYNDFEEKIIPGTKKKINLIFEIDKNINISTILFDYSNYTSLPNNIGKWNFDPKEHIKKYEIKGSLTYFNTTKYNYISSNYSIIKIYYSVENTGNISFDYKVSAYLSSDSENGEDEDFDFDGINPGESENDYVLFLDELSDGNYSLILKLFDYNTDELLEGLGAGVNLVSINMD